MSLAVAGCPKDGTSGADGGQDASSMNPDGGAMDSAVPMDGSLPQDAGDGATRDGSPMDASRDATDADSSTECPDGTQDHDDDGTCTTDCSETTCGSNASCDDASGTATCACDSGYQDNDGDGDCSEDCESAQSCPANSTCSDASGSAECECDFGYQDNDGNGSCEPGCADDTCSFNGVCDDAGGMVSCVCDAGYQGQACDECVPGLQDNDGDGACEAACLMPGDRCVEAITAGSWGQDQADVACPDLCIEAGLQWNGQWSTGESNVEAAGCESGVGSAAVCGCELQAVVPGDYCVEDITPESWGQAGADADCPELCAGEGLQWTGGWSADQADVETAGCTSGFGAAAVCGCTLPDGYCSAPEQVCDDSSGTPACSCAEGYYDNAGTCEALTECAAGSYETAAPTDTSDRECTDCEAGEYCAGGAEAPVSCEAGTTWDHDSDPATACIAVLGSCPAGTHQTAAPTATADRECTACAAGQYCAGGTESPESCEAGTTWDHDDDSSTECVALGDGCAAGTYETAAPTGTSDRECTACEPGEYCAGSTSSPVSCEAGTTWDHDADPATGCVAVTDPCAAGSYETTAPTATADRECTACDAGEYCSGGAASPTSCEAGTTWDHDSDPETVCVAVTDSCAAGSYETTAPTATVDRACTACDAGEYCAGGAASPTSCEAGTTWDHDSDPSTACVAVTGSCAAGSYETTAPTATVDRECTACAAGQYCAGGTASPTSCDAGTTWDHDSDPATACAAVTASCAAGSYETTAPTATVDRECTSCDAGQYCAGGTASPTSCDAGTTWDHDSDPATACVAVTGSCAAGSYETTAPTATVDRECTACAAGQYCAGGTASPTSCDAGTTWDHDSDPSTACVAVTGSCAAGSYETTAPTATVDRECTSCDAGQYCAGGTASPASCEAGTTWDHDSDPSTACVPVTGSCAAGSYETTAPTATVDRECTSCDAGTYCPGGTTAPVGCEVGTTWDHDGDPATACVAVSAPCSDTEVELAAPTATSDRVCTGLESCLAIKQTDPTAADGVYEIDPDGTGPIEPSSVYCDMTTDGGGYTFFKVDAGSAQNAASAEADCASRGMQLFIPRTEAHLQSAYNVATDAGYGPSGQWHYLYILGIYPDSNGATCTNRAFQSATTGCNWSASDGGRFWVSDRTDISEPNGDNSTTGSMYYGFGGGSYAVTGYNDIPSPGYTSSYYMCDTGDKQGPLADCAAILAASPDAPDGTYTIDPDGDGGADPVDVYCDMTTDGGGWTLISSEDFTGGATGWSNNSTTTCGTLGEILGGYNVLGSGASTSKSFDLLGVSHTEVWVSLDYISVDSWDGESGIVEVDGVPRFSQSFQYSDGTNICGASNSGWLERTAEVSSQVAHTSGTVTINATSTLDQPANDESFGIDNLVIRVR